MVETTDPIVSAEPDQSEVRVYDAAQIWCSAVFFGPLAGGWFLTRNMKALGETRAAINGMITVFLIFSALFLFFFSVVMIHPEILDTIPAVVIPLMIGGYFNVWAKKQEPKVKVLREHGASSVANWKVIVVGGMWAVTTWALMYALAIVRHIVLVKLGYPPS
ncbi:MAG: hypothetical protein ACAH83_15700 [Alphaproteobacteria bacterium]